MQNVAFIINPFSAKKNYHPFLEELKKKVDNPKFIISKSIKDTDSFIQNNFRTTSVFVAVGGDGTISTVAKHLIHTDKTLAIFPAGSGNGFSNETHFQKDLDDLLIKITDNKTRQIDTFTVNDLLSINVSGAGFDGRIARDFEKTSRGFANYIKVSIKTFFNNRPVEVKFHDGQYRKHNGRYLMLNIANTRQFGNNAYIAPQASKSDGLVDLVLVKKFPLAYSPLFAYRMFTKQLRDDEYLTYIPTSEIRFSVNTTTWHLDGEYTKIESPVVVKVLPGSLKILV